MPSELFFTTLGSQNADQVEGKMLALFDDFRIYY